MNRISKLSEFFPRNISLNEGDHSLLSIQYNEIETSSRVAEPVSKPLSPKREIPQKVAESAVPLNVAESPAPPAFLTEIAPDEPSSPEKSISPKKSARQPSPEPLISPPKPQPAKTADDLLDEMLGLGSGEIDSKPVKGKDLRNTGNKKISLFKFINLKYP